MTVLVLCVITTTLLPVTGITEGVERCLVAILTLNQIRRNTIQKVQPNRSNPPITDPTTIPGVLLTSVRRGGFTQWKRGNIN